MARRPRNVVPGYPVHVVQRGVNRAATFFTQHDYHYYLAALLRASQLAECAIHAYVLMTNHVHLLVTPQDVDGVSRLVQSVGRRYVRHINNRYQRTGTLWEGRFRSSIVGEESYFFACSRYIELNPVRAGIVTQPGEYRWSSYLSNVTGKLDPLLSPHPLYLALARTTEARRLRYSALFDTEIPAEDQVKLRNDLKRSAIFGSDSFQRRIAQILRRRAMPYDHGGDRRSNTFLELGKYTSRDK